MATVTSIDLKPVDTIIKDSLLQSINRLSEEVRSDFRFSVYSEHFRVVFLEEVNALFTRYLNKGYIRRFHLNDQVSHPIDCNGYVLTLTITVDFFRSDSTVLKVSMSR